MRDLAYVCDAKILLSEEDNQERLVGRLVYPHNICEQFTIPMETKLSCEQLFVLIASCILAAYVSYGGVRHTFDIPAAQLPKVTKLNYISQVFHIMGISIGKVAVALLIYRLQAPCRWRTWVLACLSIGVFVTGSLSIILYFLQCTPRQALFNPSLGKCWNPKYMNGYVIADSCKYKM